MNFLNLQSKVAALISAHATFKDAADDTVCQDLGDKKSFIEASLDISTDPTGDGYAISVWPPARGHSDSEAGGATGVDALVVVRFEVNPEMLKKLDPLPNLPDGTKQDASTIWLNTRIKDIVNAVLSAPPEVGGVKFQLAADAFELVNFDEGLVAYHIRFSRFVVFGIGI